MRTYHVAVIVGSLREASLNRKFAKALQSLAPEHLKLELLSPAQLPLYNEEADGNEVPEVLRFREAIRAADAVLIVSPEYNRSMTAVLKNALDQGSRPWGQNAWAGKPVALAGVSPGAAGTSMAQQHTRNVLSFLDMRAMSQPEMFLQAKEGMFNEDGSLSDRSAAFAQKFLNAFGDWVIDHLGREKP